MTYDPFFGEPEPAPAAQRRSEGVWTCVRRDYLDGDSAPRLAERHGVSVSAIRTRARAEGWRRVDTPDPEPEADDLAAAAESSPAELRTLAWGRAAAAVRRGRLADALGWTRLVRQLDALAEKQAAGPALQARAADSLARAAETLASLRRDRPAAKREVHELHDLHGVPGRPGGLEDDAPHPAHPRACGDPDLSQPGEEMTAVTDLDPRLREDGREGDSGLYELHELHGAHGASEAADRGPPTLSSRPERSEGPEPRREGRSLKPSRPATETEPAEAAASPPPHRSPTGPVLPPHPPAWVRHALGAR